MTITVLVSMILKPEHADVFAGRIGLVLKGTREFEGCLEINAYRNSDEPHRFAIFEQWKSRENYDAYVSYRRSTGAMDKLAATLQEPISSQILEKIT